MVVFVLCTIFVLGFVAALDYATSGVGKGGQTLTTTQTTCSGTSCERLSISSASLRTVNYTDELGVVNYANLVLSLDASGAYPVTSVNFYLNGSLAGTVQGPFEPGVVRQVNLTLPATISVSPGRTYLVNVQGNYGSGESAWVSVRLTAH